jgi:hypothetical protein
MRIGALNTTGIVESFHEFHHIIFPSDQEWKRKKCNLPG